MIITKLQVAPVELDVSSQSSSTCRASRARRVERVELCCSTCSTQPKCMGSTRRMCRVESSRAKWNLSLTKLILTYFDLCSHRGSTRSPTLPLLKVSTSVIHVNTWITTHLLNVEGWEAELDFWLTHCEQLTHVFQTWNSLPAEVMSASSLQTFKTRLKSHLFLASFP